MNFTGYEKLYKKRPFLWIQDTRLVYYISSIYILQCSKSKESFKKTKQGQNSIFTITICLGHFRSVKICWNLKTDCFERTVWIWATVVPVKEAQFWYNIWETFHKHENYPKRYYRLNITKHKPWTVQGFGTGIFWE